MSRYLNLYNPLLCVQWLRNLMPADRLIVNMCACPYKKKKKVEKSVDSIFDE